MRRTDMYRLGRRSGWKRVAWCLVLTMLPNVACFAEQTRDGSFSLAWIGNSGYHPQAGSQGSVQRALTDIWVDRDGTVFAVAPGELGVPSLAAYRNGRRVADFAGVEGLVVAGNRTHLFVGTHGGIQILSKEAAVFEREGDAGWLRIDEPGEVQNPDRSPADGYSVRGLHATERALYVSNASRNRVEEWDLRARRRIRIWPFERPGPLIADPWEEQGLWVVRERLLAPAYDALTRNRRRESDGDVLAPALLVRFSLPDGRVRETLADVGIPTALAVQIRSEDDYPALLVADNGPRQQILRYSRRNPRKSRPIESWGNRFGRLGSGGQQGYEGLFNGLAGMGLSADGSLMVAQNWHVVCERRGDYPPQCAEILTFGSAGELRHAAQALYDGHPATTLPFPPFDVFFRNVRLAVNWNSPSLEWSLAGRTTHPLLFPEDTTVQIWRRDPVIRSVLGQTLLFEKDDDTLLLYRHDPARLGNVWAPMGAFCPKANPEALWPSSLTLPDRLENELKAAAATSLLDLRSDERRQKLQAELRARIALARTFGWVWLDGRGSESLDGVLQNDEVQSIDGRLDDAIWSVDPSGGLWIVARETSHHVSGAPARFTGWDPERMDPNGVPVFRRRPSQPVPPPFSAGKVLWHRSLHATNQMLIAGTTPLHMGFGPQILHVYEGWSRSDGSVPQPRLVRTVLFQEEVPDGTSPARAEVLSMDVAGDWFFTLRLDPVRISVYDLHKGNRVATIVPADALPVRPEARKGVFLSAADRGGCGISLLVSAPSWDRLLALDWRPELVSRTVPVQPPILHGSVFSRRAELVWGTGDVGPIIGYRLYRAVGEGPFEPVTEAPLDVAFYHDSPLENGEQYSYCVSVVVDGGEGPPSNPVRLVPSATVVRYVGEDRRTMGDWRGRYGSEGYHLFGEGPVPAETGNPREPEGVSGPSVALGRRELPFVPEVRLDPALPLRTALGAEQQRVAGFLEVGEDGPVVFPVAIRNGRSLRTSLYCGSSERIHGIRVEMIDPATETVLDVREFCNEAEPGVRGRYLTWDVTGTAWVRLSVPRGTSLPDQCGINAIFFDPVTFREDSAAP